MWIEQIEQVQTTHFAMGTVMTHTLYGSQAEACLQVVEERIGFLERKMSRFIYASDISRLNQNAGSCQVRICRETFAALARAKEFSRTLQGAFDVTSAPLVALWNIGKDSFQEPSKYELREALSLVNYKDLCLYGETMTAILGRAGQALDLGGIGKGVAAECVSEIYKQFGIASGFSNLGGHVLAEGFRPDGSPWRVGIQHPRVENALIGVVLVNNVSVVTSGDYQRFSLGHDGEKFHHIFDVRTGYPCRSEFSGVTIVSADSVAADVLSTAIFILGREKGIELLKSFPGTEAVFIDRHGRVSVTSGLEDRFQPSASIKFEIVRI